VLETSHQRPRAQITIRMTVPYINEHAICNRDARDAVRARLALLRLAGARSQALPLWNRDARAIARAEHAGKREAAGITQDTL